MGAQTEAEEVAGVGVGVKVGVGVATVAGNNSCSSSNKAR